MRKGNDGRAQDRFAAAGCRLRRHRRRRRLLAVRPAGVERGQAIAGRSDRLARQCRERRAGQGGRRGLPIPRFVSLKTDTVNVRRGPSSEHAIAWVFKRKGLPVEIIAEFEHWRRIRDSEGEEGWVYMSMLAGHRTAIVAPWKKDQAIAMRRSAEDQAAALAMLKSGCRRRSLGLHRRLVRHERRGAMTAGSSRASCSASIPASGSPTELASYPLRCSLSRTMMSMRDTRLPLRRLGQAFHRHIVGVDVEEPALALEIVVEVIRRIGVEIGPVRPRSPPRAGNPPR